MAAGKIVQAPPEAVEIVHTDGMQVIAEHGFDGTLPGRLDLELRKEPRRRCQAVVREPVICPARGILRRGLLQRLQRGLTTAQPRQLRADPIQFAGQLRGLIPRSGEVAGQAFTLLLMAGDGELRFRQFLPQRRRILLVLGRGEGALLCRQLVHARLQALQGMLEVLDAGLLHLGLLPRFRGAVVERVPALLPALHGLLGSGQCGGGFLGRGVEHLALRGQGGEFLLPGIEPFAILAQVAFRLIEIASGLRKVLAQLPAALLVMLNALLDARDLGTEAVVATLDLVEDIRAPTPLHPLLFDARVHLLVLREHRLEGYLEFTDPAGAAGRLLVDVFPLQRQQLGLQGALLFLQGPVFFRRLRLSLQVLELPLELVAQVRQALEVLEGAAHAGLRFLAPLLVFRNTRRFLDENTQFLRPGLDETGDHALLDNRVAAGPQARSEKDIGDVAAPAAGAVQVVLGLALSGDLAAGGDFGIAGIGAAHTAVTVVEDQFDGCLTNGLAVDGAVENNIGHGLAAQVPGGTLPHDPAHGVDDVRLAAAVRTHHRGHIAGEGDRGGIHEGFEPRQLD